jgi:hypothetical protein
MMTFSENAFTFFGILVCLVLAQLDGGRPRFFRAFGACDRKAKKESGSAKKKSVKKSGRKKTQIRIKLDPDSRAQIRLREKPRS